MTRPGPLEDAEQKLTEILRLAGVTEQVRWTTQRVLHYEPVSHNTCQRIEREVVDFLTREGDLKPSEIIDAWRAAQNSLNLMRIIYLALEQVRCACDPGGDQ